MGGQITALVMQKKNKERVNVFIEDEFAFGLTLNEALHLKKGQVLSDQAIEDLKARDEIETTHEAALRFLSYRPRSMSEVSKNLSEKGFNEIAIEKTLTRLEDVGLLDDVEFARLWVANRDQSEPRGKLALRYELRQKGISDQIIDNALDDYDEAEAAYHAATNRLRRFEGADESAFKKQMGPFLQRRGFPYPLVKDVLDRVWRDALSSNTESQINT